MMAILSIYWGFAAEVDYSRKTFYVDCARRVSGNGTSWKDALSTDEFVTVLKKVNSGTTFYLTKGEYIPSAPAEAYSIAFEAYAGVTIRGGYDPTNESDGYSPRNLTTLTLANGYSDIANFRMDPKSPTEIYDINFKGRPTQEGTLPCRVTIVPGEANGNGFFRFERCTFNQNAGISMSFQPGNGIFNQCDFDFSQGGYVYLGEYSLPGGPKQNQITFSNSSFSGDRSCIEFHFQNNLKIINCTFGGRNGVYCLSDLIKVQVPNNSTEEGVNSNDNLSVELTHNTILGNVRIEGIKCIVNGNYIHGRLIADNRDYNAKNTQNVFVESDDMSYTVGGDILLKYERISEFFPFRNSTYTFVKNPGKLTKTVALLTDYYCADENDFLLFRNLGESELDIDQIGQERYKYPCFGAYELKFNDQKNYYVKSTGTGDGSNWKNAMGINRFTQIFKIAQSGSTFHFAEGVYTPTDKSYSDGFTTQQSINLQGGYSINPAEGEKPNPSIHETIFNADKSENVDFSDEGLGYLSNSLTNIVKYEPNEDGTIKISGIKFTRQNNDPKDHSKGALMIAAVYNFDKKLDVVLENCTFDNNNNAFKALNCPNIKFRKCHFDNTRVHAINASNINNFEIESCSFHKNGTAIMATSKNLDISNSTFLENSNTLDLSILDTGKVNVTNNTIIGGIKIWKANEPNISIVGNIITGPNISSDNIVNKSRNNLFAYDDENETETTTTWDNSIWDTSDDQFTPKKDLFMAMDYTYDENWNLIPSPTYDRGSFVIPLQSDKTRDGINLRFPLEKTSVERDQRGVRREKLTCVGAYEYPGDYPYIPDAFTPYSRNGKNDIFMKGYEVYIYNRYGSLLCHSTKGWDGYYKGKLVEPGVYIYVVNTNAGSWKGTVEVIKSM